jgi:hypothetical protein
MRLFARPGHSKYCVSSLTYGMEKLEASKTSVEGLIAVRSQTSQPPPSVPCRAHGTGNDSRWKGFNTPPRDVQDANPGKSDPPVIQSMPHPP